MFRDDRRPGFPVPEDTPPMSTPDAIETEAVKCEPGPGVITPTVTRPHLFQLDGWRGISILCVLAAHMVPVGTKTYNYNEGIGLVGMALFFNLSGYLITSFLLAKPDVRVFLIRRIFRILPLASVYLVWNLVTFRSPPAAWAANFAFAINYLTQYMVPRVATFWSLCVELHFYSFVALVVALAGRKGLWILVPLCIPITIARIQMGVFWSIETHLRADEILAGACLALFGVGTVSNAFTWPFRKVSPWVWAILLFLFTVGLDSPTQYARPYVSALLVGSTLARKDDWFTRQLRSPVLLYLAGISYALYVIHPITYSGWMNEGSSAVRYLLKRPLSFAILFTLANLSTKYWENYWIGLGKRLTTPSPRPAA